MDLLKIVFFQSLDIRKMELMNAISSNHDKQIAVACLLAILSFFVLVGIDQATKYWIDRNMELYSSIPVIRDVFEIHYIRNEGAAWGIFAQKQLWFCIIAILFLIGGSIVYLRCVQMNSFKALRAALVLVLSGAMGNLIDRVRFHYVIDFLYVKAIRFPVFNVADCYVTVGCFLMILLCIFYYPEQELDKLFQIQKSGRGE